MPKDDWEEKKFKGGTVLKRLGSYRATRADQQREFERLLDLTRTDPTSLESIIKEALVNPKGGNFVVGMALSFISEEAFARLIDSVFLDLAALRGNVVAEIIVANASLQFPQLLHPHLPTIFENWPTQRWAWRESGDTSLEFLRGIAGSPQEPPQTRRNALLCLLETRTEAAFTSAIELAQLLNLSYTVEAFFLDVGYKLPGRQLYNSEPLHLTFEPGYFEQSSPDWSERITHPTWLFPRTGPACRFGGTDSGQCDLCKGPLHHLLTFPGALLRLSGPSPLTLSTCLSCLGWVKAPLFYRHSEDGRPVPLDAGDAEPEFHTGPLKETLVHIDATPARWRWQDWELSDSRQNLHKVGGYPCWVGSAYYPACPDCNKRMRFILQLDSELPTADGDEWKWGFGGLCYAFWCDKCWISSFLWQYL